MKRACAERVEVKQSKNMKVGFIYIMTNKNNTTLYTGVTSDLPKRVQQHKENQYQQSFTAKYNLHKLVY